MKMENLFKGFKTDNNYAQSSFEKEVDEKADADLAG